MENKYKLYSQLHDMLKINVIKLGLEKNTHFSIQFSIWLFKHICDDIANLKSGSKLMLMYKVTALKI